MEMFEGLGTGYLGLPISVTFSVNQYSKRKSGLEVYVLTSDNSEFRVKRITQVKHGACSRNNIC